MAGKLKAETYRQLKKSTFFRTASKNRANGLKVLEDLSGLTLTDGKGNPILENLKLAASMVYFGNQSLAEQNEGPIDEHNWKTVVEKCGADAKAALENPETAGPIGVLSSGKVSAVRVDTSNMKKKTAAGLNDISDSWQDQISTLSFKGLLDDQIAACEEDAFTLERVFEHLAGLDKPEEEQDPQELSKFLQDIAVWKAENVYNCGQKFLETHDTLVNSDYPEEQAFDAAWFVLKNSGYVQKDMVQTEAMELLFDKFGDKVKAQFEDAYSNAEYEVAGGVYHTEEFIVRAGKAVINHPAPNKDYNDARVQGAALEIINEAVDESAAARKRSAWNMPDLAEIVRNQEKAEEKAKKKALDDLAEWNKALHERDRYDCWRTRKDQAVKAYDAAKKIQNQIIKEYDDISRKVGDDRFVAAYGGWDSLNAHVDYLQRWNNRLSTELRTFELQRDNLETMVARQDRQNQMNLQGMNANQQMQAVQMGQQQVMQMQQAQFAQPVANNAAGLNNNQLNLANNGNNVNNQAMGQYNAQNQNQQFMNGPFNMQNGSQQYGNQPNGNPQNREQEYLEMMRLNQQYMNQQAQNGQMFGFGGNGNNRTMNMSQGLDLRTGAMNHPQFLDLQTGAQRTGAQQVQEQNPDLNIQADDAEQGAKDAAIASLLNLTEQYLSPEAWQDIENNQEKIYDYLKIDGKSLRERYPDHLEEGCAVFMRLLSDNNNQLVSRDHDTETRINKEDDVYKAAVEPFDSYVKCREAQRAQMRRQPMTYMGLQSAEYNQNGLRNFNNPREPLLRRNQNEQTLNRNGNDRRF